MSRNQLIIQKRQPTPTNSLVTNFPVKKGIKFGIESNTDFCTKCAEPLIVSTACRECHRPAELTCIGCGIITWQDLHEFCYCQLELLVPTIPKVRM